MSDNHLILTKPIYELATSAEFLDMAQKNQFKTLWDILKFPVHELLSLPLFDYRMHSELIAILQSYQLEDLLKED